METEMNNKQEQQERNTTYKIGSFFEKELDRIVPCVETKDWVLAKFFGPKDKENAQLFKQALEEIELPSIDTADYEKEALKMVKQQSDSDFRNSGSLGGTATGIDRIPFVVMPAVAKLMVKFYQSMSLKQSTEETKPVADAIQELKQWGMLFDSLKEWQRQDVLKCMNKFAGHFKGKPSIQQISDAWDAAFMRFHYTRLMKDGELHKWDNAPIPPNKDTYLSITNK